jgi:peptidoglycan/xylan/chitin deacetylase (PgdA/CDA1 family)
VSSRFALVVTIDTEADNMWARPRELTYRNTRNLDRLQRLFDEFGVRPTYLTTHEVASDGPSMEFLAGLQAQKRAEVGAHLHPWSNPPYTRIADDEDAEHPYPHEYPLQVFEAKMRVLGEALVRATGRAPTSYRAGRWGFVAAHGEALRRMGYVVDTSVTPGVSWERYAGRSGGSGGPSYAGAPRVPYRLSAGDARVPGGGLLEVPVSIEWNRALPPAFESRADRMRPYSIAARLLRRAGWLRPLWLRPYRRFSEDDLRALCDRLAARRRPVWNLMFHSSEAVVGTSPYSPDEVALEAWYAKLRIVLERARTFGAEPMTLSAFARRWLGETAPQGA